MQPATPPVCPSAAAPRPTLLLVDTHPARLECLHQALGPGYLLLCAPSTAQALALSQQQPPGLALLDLHLPHRESFRLCEMLRTLPRLRHLPVLFLTRHDDPANTQHARSLGAAGLVHEPIDAQELRRTVDTHLALAAQALALHHTMRQREQRSAEQLRRHYAGSHCLVVDDDPFSLELVSTQLSSTGMQVHTAHSGEAALRQAQAQAYDLVLMDIHMPGMGGLAACRKLRRLPGWQHTPILALTGATELHDRRACEDAGINDLVTKPISPPNLERTVLSWLTPSPSHP